MGKFSSGPDWTDIACWMAENSRLTGHEFILLVTSVGCVGGLPLSCTVLACEKSLPPWSEGGGTALTVNWPNRESATFEGAVFKALVSVDAIMFRQSELGLDNPA